MSVETDEFRKRIEDEICTAIESWCKAKQRIAYLYLFNLGYRSDGISFEIEKDIRRELKKSQG